MLSRTKEMDRIHKTSNQMSDLRFMVFTELIVVVRVTPRIMDMARTRITWAPALSARMSRGRVTKVPTNSPSNTRFHRRINSETVPLPDAGFFRHEPKVVRESVNDK